MNGTERRTDRQPTLAARARTAAAMLLACALAACTAGPTALPAVPPPPTAMPPTAAPTAGAVAPPTPTEKPQPIPAPAQTATPEPTPCPAEPLPTTTPVAANTLRGLAQSWGIQIGAAVATRPLLEEPIYGEVLAREFGMLTPENALKFDHVHPGRDTYDFGRADALVTFAESHGMQVRGHTLVWHNQLPAWLSGGNWSRDELLAILHDHVTTVAGHYRGRIVAWDVVNEAVGDDGRLRDTLWLRVIGPEYIDLAFEWAHEADPDALLFLNDYGGEGLSPKSDAIHALAQDLLARGVPLDGVGLQMHVTLDGPDPKDVSANIDRLSALGLQVHITEMDVRITEPITPEKLKAQAGVYRDMLSVCLYARWCTAFVLWGFADCHSWIPGFFPGCGAGLVFDEAYNPKPACDALEEVLGGH